MPAINHKIWYTFFSAAIIILGTLLAISYARGSWRITNDGFKRQSGLLNANSFPAAAQVFINDRLVTATDETLYLDPGEYQIEIIKDGYWPWKKSMKIQPELVTQTNATLFPIAPSLTPLTFTGVENITPSPDGQKLLYYTSSASAQTKNGLYVLELTDSFLSLQRGSRQIAVDVPGYDLANAKIIWSPDSSEVVVITKDKQMLLQTNTTQDLVTQQDISFQLKQILGGWEEEMYIRERQFMAKFPEKIIEIATSSAKNVYMSPDKKRIMYTATANFELPTGLVPPLPSANTQPEQRQVTAGNTYIYDREEDKNFLVGLEPASNGPDKISLASDLYNRSALTLDASPSAFTKLLASQSAQTAANFQVYHSSMYLGTFQWFTDSKHVIQAIGDSIQIFHYDGTNPTRVYSGPFSNNFIYPWPDGSKLLIRTRFNPDTPYNLYAIELKS